MEAIKVLAKILTNILTALYEPFGFSLLLSFLAMFFYLYAYEPEEAGKGWKSAIALIVKVVVSKNIYFLFVHVIRYCSVPDHHHFE